MPLADGVSILHPEHAVVKFGSTVQIDIGSLCYLTKAVPEKSSGRSGRRVALNSLCPARRERVRRLLDHINLTARNSGRRHATLHDHFSRLITFVSWADENRWADVLANEAMARPALLAYLEFVRDRVTRNEISHNSGAKSQNTVVAVLSEFFEIDFGRGINLLVRDRRLAEITVPPPERSQARVLSLCECLFNGLCDLTLQTQPYPFALRMPSYLNFPEDRLWVFPATVWFKTPAMIRTSAPHAGWNYQDGRLATEDELIAQYPMQRLRWSQMKARVRKLLDDANSDSGHDSRWRLAGSAQNAFIIMFLAATGMNWTQAMTLPWSGDYDIKISRQAFRTIKWRAAGKPISFEIPVAFMPAFKRFLGLRKFLLRQHAFDFLFCRARSRDHAPHIINTSLAGVYKSLRRIDPGLEPVMPRAWRAAKSDWLVRNADPATAARVLQNTERTILRHYAEGTETQHHEEMGKFLGEVASAVISPSEAVQNGTIRSVGICASFGKPAPLPIPVPVQPDCDRVEGCLFCEQIRVHADETDARKLLSCRYVINLTAPLSETEEEYNRVLRPIITRIDDITSDIATHDAAMVERVRREVEEDNEFDPYWAGKAEMLMTLGF
jgi:hypothetical protein